MTSATHLGLHVVLFILSAVATTPVQEHVRAHAIEGGARTVTIEAHAGLVSDIDHNAQADSVGDTTARLMRTGKQALAEEGGRDAKGADSDLLDKADPAKPQDKAPDGAEPKKKSWIGAGMDIVPGMRQEPINCKWEKWGKWGKCTETDYKGPCQGDRERTRKIQYPAKHGGDECKGARQQSQTCHVEACQTTTTVDRQAAPGEKAAPKAAAEAKAAAPEAAKAAAPAKKSNSFLYSVIGGAIGLVLLGGAAFAMHKPKKQQFDENGDPIEDLHDAYDDAGDLGDYQDDEY